jgi:predicted nucleotide-binding protein (sugar kinase/HSP70/actin superfamily)
MTQTGGQCRATNYLAVLKKAMIDAGFEHVPALSFATSDAQHNQQPGFNINWTKMARTLTVSFLYADSISQMFYSTKPRELVKGTCDYLKKIYIDKAQPFVLTEDRNGLLSLLSEAVQSFNNVPVFGGKLQRIGIVGEIYVKYNDYANFNVVNWLIEQHIEVIVPTIFDFFLQAFANRKVDVENNLAKKSFTDVIMWALFKVATNYTRKVDKIMSAFRFAEKRESIFEKAENASKILSPVNQYGEGWLIPAEIHAFAHRDVKSIISLQPFGCIANHIISKGIETRVKKMFPDINLLFLDFDNGISEVNIHNRLHFMINDAHKEVHTTTIEVEVPG